MMEFSSLSTPSSGWSVKNPPSSKSSFVPPKTKIRNYDIINKLGQGSFGAVYQARSIISSDEFAVKVSLKKNSKEVSLFDELLKEAKIISSLKHRNIIRLHEVIRTKKMVQMVLELARGGDLSDYCSRHAPLTEQQIWSIIRQAASAFSYMHSKNIVHGDIKLDNILYTDRGVLKVTDFGLSSAFKPGALVYGIQGTHGYMAPEIYSANGYNGPPVDVWALGVVLHLLINNKFPFSRKTMKKIVSGKLPFNFEPPTSASHTCAELLKSMLCLDPMKRISMKEILVHPFIKTKSHGPSKRTCDRESADSGPSKRLCKSKGSPQNIKSHEDKKSEEEIMVEPGKKNKIPGKRKRGRDSEGLSQDNKSKEDKKAKVAKK